MPLDPTDLDTLLPHEEEALRRLYYAWKAARDENDYHKADALRAELLEWQDTLTWINSGQWHPVAEPPWHREQRYNERVARGNGGI